jgi:NAD(P)-dependent dehydrogenase (short-subunit alcohol dehydrogenase family)
MTALRYESLTDKVVLVTGASRGIGRAIALAFGEQGALVLVNSRTHDRAAMTVEAIVAAGGSAETAVADVGDPSAAQALITQIVRRHGRFDVLVNNSAINPVVPLLEMTQEMWEETHRVNEWALFHCGQPAARQMVAQGGGSIVVIGSPAAEDTYDSQTPYCASKAGLQMLAMGMAWEWGPLGVRTNVVQPGWIETALNREYLSSGPDVRERVIKQIPLRRTGLPDDVAPAVLWLCSDDAAYVNGATIQVDGGLLAGRPTVVSKRFEWARG